MSPFINETRLPIWRNEQLHMAVKSIDEANTRESFLKLLETPGWEAVKFGLKYRPTYPDCSLLLMSAGYHNIEVAGALKVSVETLNQWRKKYVVFGRAMKIGEQARDELRRLVIALRCSDRGSSEELIDRFIAEHEAGTYSIANTTSRTISEAAT